MTAAAPFPCPMCGFVDEYGEADHIADYHPMFDTSDLISLTASEPTFGVNVGQTVLRVHHATQCAGRACCVHNPSDHHMRSWPQHWRADAGPAGVMERICPHLVGHPDPDHMSYARSIDPDTADGIHSCDGCC